MVKFVEHPAVLQVGFQLLIDGQPDLVMERLQGGDTPPNPKLVSGSIDLSQHNDTLNVCIVEHLLVRSLLYPIVCITGVKTHSYSSCTQAVARVKGDGVQHPFPTRGADTGARLR